MLSIGSHLRPKGSVEIVAQPYGGFLVSSASKEYEPINESAYQFFAFLERNHLDLERTFTDLARAYSIPKTTLFGDFEPFLLQYIERGIFTHELGDSGSALSTDKLVVSYAPEKNKLKAVKAAVELTTRCNLSCAYCYAEAGAKGSELSADEWISILHKLYQKGLRVLEFTGGEVFLYPSFYEILEWADQYFITEILTNGTLINKGAVELLRRLNRLKAVQISLDSPTSAPHDEFRGRGSWRKAMDAIERLVDAGIHVRISMTLHAKNAGLTPAMEHLANKLGVELILQSMKPAGRARYLPLHLYVHDPEDKSNSDFDFSPGYEVYCQAQLGYISIASDGGLKPCNMRRNFFYQIGLYKNYRDTLNDKWYDKWYGETHTGNTFMELTENFSSLKQEKPIDKAKMIYPSCVLEAFLRLKES